MLKSMTGYGKSIKKFENFDITVEIKSVNSKYFDIFFKIPKQISSFEILLRSLLQEKLIRGKVDVKIEFLSKSSIKIPKVNEKLLRDYKILLEQICTITNIENNIHLDHYMKLPDIIEFSANEELENELYTNIKETIFDCIEKIDHMRLNEGNSLEKDIIERLNNIDNLVNNIKNISSDLFDYWKNKFIKRIEDFEIKEINEERIIQEASIYAEKADITEEITRLKCHIDHFKNIMANEYPVGKKLDFLCQELNREFNTISSKSFKNEIINNVIEGKTEIDRIREQIQNIV